MPVVPKIRSARASNDSNSSLDVPGPTTVVLGDMLLDITATDPDAGTSSSISPSGFAKLWESDQPSDHGGWIKIFGRTAVSADVTSGTSQTYRSPNQSGSETVHSMIAVYDFNPDQLFAVNPVYGASGSRTGNIPSQSIVPSVEQCLLLSLWAANRNNSSNSGDNKGWGTIPSPWSQVLERGGSWERSLLGSLSAPGKDGRISSVDATLSGGSSTSSSWASMAVALNPKPDPVISNPDLPGRFLIGA